LDAHVPYVRTRRFFTTGHAVHGRFQGRAPRERSAGTAPLQRVDAKNIRRTVTVGDAFVLLVLTCDVTCPYDVFYERRGIAGIEGKSVEMFRP